MSGEPMGTSQERALVEALRRRFPGPMPSPDCLERTRQAVRDALAEQGLRKAFRERSAPDGEAMARAREAALRALASQRPARRARRWGWPGGGWPTWAAVAACLAALAGVHGVAQRVERGPGAGAGLAAGAEEALLAPEPETGSPDPALVAIERELRALEAVEGRWDLGAVLDLVAPTEGDGPVGEPGACLDPAEAPGGWRKGGRDAA